MNKKAVIAMSGGVDSSVAAYLMKKDGFDCIGVTMKLFHNEDIEVSRDKTCCSLDDVNDAQRVAFAMDMPHYVFNFSDEFKEKVIDRFVTAYENGETPDPCIDCNRYLKFDKLYHRARELDCDYIVTGHYARIELDEQSGRCLLKKAAYPEKDQSYVLYAMTQEQLAHTMFPLGNYTKPEIREIAEEQGFLNAKKHDSQDICFVPNGSYADFIEYYTKRTYPGGDFVDTSGNVLGEHKGIIRYTIGQRKGLGISYTEPLYVLNIDKDKNTVTVGKDSELYSNRLTAGNINLISVEKIDKPMRVKAKIRYRHTEQPATVIQVNDKLEVTFDEPQRAITRGQAVVLYDGDTVVGGGTIL
ncbi:MAG: tRNA 2-thiouridine(34) synthase MnmA [Oscillospiraceae bacterium]|nr:tRNA 2-thiouridine(34) synthase MnmA [Oscillospiraceae bacterium]